MDRTVHSEERALLPPMTLMISCLEDGKIAVAMDTHAMGGLVDDPQSKFWVHPSGAYVLAGTGLADVVEPWIRSAAKSPSPSASDVLASAGPTLMERWRTVTSGLDQAHRVSGTGLHTTGYVFSFADRSPLRTSFSSRDGFEAKRYERQGLSWFPLTPVPPPSVLAGIDDSDGGLMRLARHVATECDRDASGEVRIDGELRVVRIAPDGLIDGRSLGRIRPEDVA